MKVMGWKESFGELFGPSSTLDSSALRAVSSIAVSATCGYMTTVYAFRAESAESSCSAMSNEVENPVSPSVDTQKDPCCEDKSDNLGNL